MHGSARDLWIAGPHSDVERRFALVVARVQRSAHRLPVLPDRQLVARTGLRLSAHHLVIRERPHEPVLVRCGRRKERVDEVRVVQLRRVVERAVAVPEVGASVRRREREQREHTHQRDVRAVHQGDH